MADTKLVIKDVDGGSVAIIIESDPPIPEDIADGDIDSKLTNAQKLAIFAYQEVVDVIMKTGGEEWGKRGNTN